MLISTSSRPCFDLAIHQKYFHDDMYYQCWPTQNIPDLKFFGNWEARERQRRVQDPAPVSASCQPGEEMWPDQIKDIDKDKDKYKYNDKDKHKYKDNDQDQDKAKTKTPEKKSLWIILPWTGLPPLSLQIWLECNVGEKYNYSPPKTADLNNHPGGSSLGQATIQPQLSSFVILITPP